VLPTTKRFVIPVSFVVVRLGALYLGKTRANKPASGFRDFYGKRGEIVSAQTGNR